MNVTFMKPPSTYQKVLTMFRLSILDFDGFIFDPSIRKSSYQEAVDKTLAFGLDAIAEKTPVRTGYLKNHWDSDGETIFNETPYTWYVERGTRFFVGRWMVAQSLEEIQEEFNSNISEMFKNV